MSARTAHGRLAWVAALAIVAGLALHAGYLARAGADAVYMDSLRLLGQWSELMQGRLSLLQWWGQQGSPHSGLLFQSLLAANAAWFGLDTLLANRLTGVAIAAVAALFCAAYLADLRRTQAPSPSVLACAVVCAIVGLCFSLSGFELLTLDLGLALWLKNALIFVLFLLHARSLRGARPPAWTASLLLSAYGVAVLVLGAMGWAYAMVGAIVAVQALHHLAQRQWPTPVQLVLPVALLLALLAVMLVKRQLFGGGEEGSAVLGVDSPRQFLLALASIFVNAEAAARLGLPGVVLTLLGALLTLGFGAAALLRVLDRKASLLPVHLIAYASLCAISFVLARGAEGDQMVMASRYHMDLFPGLVGALWVLSLPQRGVLRLGPRASAACAGGLLLLLIVLQAGQFAVEWKAAPYRKAVFQAMNTALRAGVPDQAAADLLQAPLADARRAVAVMRREQLAVFRDAPAMASGCDPQWTLGTGWHAPEAGGTWSSARALFTVPACGCGYRVALTLPAGHAPREVTIAAQGQARRLVAQRLRPGQSVEITLPASAGTQQYALAVSATTVPAAAGINADTRALGVYMGVPQALCAHVR